MYVRFCGINSTHNKFFKIEKPTGFGDYLFLRLKSPALFHINGAPQYAAADDVILYSKGAPQYYEALESFPYSDDFIFFDTETEEDRLFMDRLSLQYDQLLHLPHIHTFMNIQHMIYTEFIAKTNQHRESVHCLLKYFLIKLSESMNTDYSSCDHALLEQFNELRFALYNTPAQKWTVNDMAAQVRLSPSYFQSQYKKIFHISCMEDLFTSRMDHARTLLATTHLPINRVGEECGYESNIYFSRHFKIKVGMTPSEYRNKYADTSAHTSSSQR